MRHGPRCLVYRWTTPAVRCTGEHEHLGRHRWLWLLRWQGRRVVG